MKEKNKIWLGWLAFFFVVFHVFAISVYTTPDQIRPTGLVKFVEPYVFPVFKQKWRMFYPCPTKEGRFKVKITYEDEVTDWFYPTKDDFKWYNTLRFTHHSELVLLEGNLAHLVSYDLEVNDWSFDQAMNPELDNIYRRGHSYLSVKKYMFGIGRKLKNKNPVNVDAICELHDVVSGEKGDFHLPTFNYSNAE